MECPACGRQNEENHNFCYYCGFDLKDFDPSEDIQQNLNAKYARSVIVNTASINAVPINPEDEPSQPMKVWQWAVYFMLLLIPFFGLIWLILTFIWAFGKRGTKERKQMAKGLLIATLIVVVAALIFMIYMISVHGLDYFVNYITGGRATNADAYLNDMGGFGYY